MGAMTNDAALMDRIRKAGAAAGEKVWELPMYDEYKELINSDVADMKNSGGRQAGSISGGLPAARSSSKTRPGSISTSPASTLTSASRASS